MCNNKYILIIINIIIITNILLCISSRLKAHLEILLNASTEIMKLYKHFKVSCTSQ